MSVLSSLTNRIFLASALLVIVSMGIAIYRVNVSVATQAEDDLRNGLAEAASLVDQTSRAQFADFVVKGQLIADLPVLKGAAATGDAPTVQPIADDYRATIGADLFVVTDRADRVLARSGRLAIGDADVAGILAACRSSRDGTFFWPIVGGMLHVTAIPMTGVGTLITGASLDREAALALKRATNSEIAFATNGRVVATSLDTPDAGVLGAAAGRLDVFTLPIGSEEYVGRAQRLAPPDIPNGPVALVLRSRTEHLRFLPGLHWQIAITGLAAVLVATLVGYLVARTVTRPLRALTGAMGEMAATGDLTRALPALGRYDDEDVRLVAMTFHRLTSALDRFQREAALRERLSSLGRLSTVVAHEIRNPLMIIKAAARNLRRHPAGDIEAIASNIDEEVARLNRVVSDVLDFARPIDFEIGPADLADVARSAVQAATAAAPDVAVTTSLPETAVPVLTDAERVRSVLVNVLTNAQEAVRPTRDVTSSVTLTLGPGAPGRWRLTVADRGTGIAPADLPRVFDPFFTTRRGGSGLGLAIARNVIEGLGGTITVDSHQGAGTTVAIDLPERPVMSEVQA